MPKKQPTTRMRQRTQSELTYAASLQEAANYLKAAEIEARKMDDDETADHLKKMGRNLKVLHNKHSSLKMP